MLIKEVEYVVGLSSKNIRYYEDVGLIMPTRNSQNDYRIYSNEDIERLKKIKFLRELNVPIREIKDLVDGKVSLTDCMRDRVCKIENEEKIYKDIKSMCSEIIKNNDSFDSIDITKYFLGMNIINKEGFTLRDVRSNNGRKIWGACLSSFIFSFFFIIMIVSITYFQFTESDNMSWIIYYILIGILSIPIISIGYNLVLRIMEIKGGEEDEASKY